jgi:hypothetical protein
VIGGAALMMNRRTSPDPLTGPSASTAGTALTPVTPTSTSPIPSDQGLLLLSASPWGELDRIVSKSSQQEVPLTDDERSTPLGIRLQPGDYSVTLNGPSGKSTTVDVSITAGRTTPKHVSMSGVDLDTLAQDALAQEKRP